MSTKFTFLILPEVHILDLAGPDQAIHEAIDYKADFSIEYCSIDKKLVTSSGLPFGKITHFSEVKFSKGDYLIIPGSSYSYLTSTDFKNQKELFSWIKNLYLKGINLCSICMGAFVLAEAGILNGVNCTTHFKKTTELQKLYPETLVIENILFTEQNRIYTSAGIASGIDLTLHLIEKLKGSHFAHLVARELVVYNRRGGNDRQQSDYFQFRNHIHSGIHTVQDYLFEHIHIKHKIQDLADRAAMSERNFTRTFKKETGLTVLSFINELRSMKALELLKNPNLSAKEIAANIGLKSEKQLSRILKKRVYEK